jgi:hypothetical protein
LLVSHWWSQNTSRQKTIPCFFINPSCDGIVIRKGINNIKKLCSIWTTKSKCSQSQVHNLVLMNIKVEKVLSSFIDPITWTPSNSTTVMNTKNQTHNKTQRIKHITKHWKKSFSKV